MENPRPKVGHIYNPTKQVSGRVKSYPGLQTPSLLHVMWLPYYCQAASDRFSLPLQVIVSPSL